MTQSSNSTILTKAFETCRLQAYWDKTYRDAAKTQKRWSIGWGHTLNVSEHDTCTQDDADGWLQLNQQQAALQLLHSIPDVVTGWEFMGRRGQSMFDAVTDFIYNVGIGEFDGSTLKRLLKGALATQAANEFLKWNILSGEHSNGLLRRRLAERALFLGDFKADGGLKLTKEDFPDAVWF